jgi:RsiW-degrading membrane proteinase PrsW (M82 family)
MGVIAVVGVLRLVAVSPPAMLALAVLPALGAALLVVVADRWRARPAAEPEPWTALIASVAWGAAVAAALAATLNALFGDWLAGTVGASEGRALAPVVVGPLVEEVAKAAALVVLLLVWRDHVGGVWDGIVYGALVGIGFAMAENVEYFTLAAVQGGPEGLRRSLYTRAVLGALNHAVFTATTGAAIGWAWQAATPRARRLAPLAGLAAAILAHVVWNRIAAALIEQRLCGAPTLTAPCLPTPALVDLLITTPVIVATFLAPSITLLLLAAARSTRDAAPRS